MNIYNIYIKKTARVMYFYSFPLNFPQDIGFFSCQFCDLAGSHQARDQLVSTE